MCVRVRVPVCVGVRVLVCVVGGDYDVLYTYLVGLSYSNLFYNAFGKELGGRDMPTCCIVL